MKCGHAMEHRWCGYCYAARRGRESHPGHRRRKGQPERMTDPEMIMAMKRPTDNPKEVAGAKVVDDVLKGWLPHVHEFLTELLWEDGKPRKPGTLLILAQDGLWKACIHDTDQRVSGWLSGESWEGLLESVNKGLGDNTIVWRLKTR